MATGRYNLTVLQRDNDTKRRIIEAINYEDSQSIYLSSRGFKSAHESILQLPTQFESRHEDAIFRNDSAISPEPTTGRGDDCNPSTTLPIFKSLKVGDRVLATVDLPRHLWSEEPGAARRTRGTVFATVKAVIHSGFSSAKYDILLDGPECSQDHRQSGKRPMGQEEGGRKRLLRDNPNLVTVGWASLQAVSSEPPPPLSTLPPPLRSPVLHVSGQGATAACVSRDPREMAIPQPPPPPPPPSHFPPPPVPPRSESRRPVILVGAAEPAAPIAAAQGAQQETANSEPTPSPSSSTNSSAALLNPSLFAGRAKGGWRSAIKKP